MHSLDRVYGRQGVLAILGSGMHWSWFDALFMSAFFQLRPIENSMSEIGTVLVFACCVPFCLLGMRRIEAFERMVPDRRFVVLFSVLGTVGSALFALSNVLASWALLVAGGLCAGAYMAFTQMGWCAAYSHEGAKTATPLLSGAFACAIAFDAVALLMQPVASVVLFALLPAASGAVFLALDPSWRTYHRCPGARDAGSDGGRRRPRMASHLGVSFTLVSALVIVFVGFGYIQHMISFGGAPGTSPDSGVLVQTIRGVVAVALFAALVFSSLSQAVVYRVGLLLMIAGCLVMPFVLGSGSMWVSGALIIAGFTAFDVLIYVVFCEVAYASSASPVKTIAVMRIFTCLGYCVGAVSALVLSGSGAHLSPLYAQEATLVAFLLTIATVLMLSGEDFWVVLGMSGYRLEDASDAPSRRGRDDQTPAADLLAERLVPFGLTARELEIVRHLAAGRTQAWIAQSLGISENTVGTHVRHIYEKTGVHNRSQFIDMSASLSSGEGARGPSPEGRDCAQ